MADTIEALAPAKRCTRCATVKPLAQFSLSRQGVRGAIYRSDCKPCCSERAMQWFKANPERADRARHAHTMRAFYGITPEQYEAMLTAQDGKCAICGEGEPAAHGRTGRQFRLSVDHDHSTGRVRGLLCQKCNRAIGLMGDNTETLRRALDYLERL